MKKRVINKIAAGLAAMIFFSSGFPVYAAGESPEGTEYLSTEVIESDKGSAVPEDSESADPDSEATEEVTPDPDPEAQTDEDDPKPEEESEEETNTGSVSFSERLIVISSSGVREGDAIIAQYGELYLLGYETRELLNEAFSYYSEDGVHVEEDTALAAENVAFCKFPQNGF